MDYYLLPVSENYEAIGELWKRLQFENDHSYFISWEVISYWLRHVDKNVPLFCVVFEDHGKPEACAILTYRTNWKHRFIPSRTISLNSSGLAKYDRLFWIEYNGILGQNCTKETIEALLNIFPHGCDEVLFPGMDFSSDLTQTLKTQQFTGFAFTEDNVQTAYYVDLAKVRENNNDLLPLIKSNTRSQIRRSYRIYREQGSVIFECADTTKYALDIFSELFDLHKMAFKQRNRVSHFSTSQAYDFHRKFIQERFDFGEIQMIRVSTKKGTIGCLYNFVYQGRVYFFQNGMNYQKDNRLKPGLICHVEAIQHNAIQGNDFYDFLAGNERFKASLSNGNNASMIWGRLQRRSLPFVLERWIYNKLNRYRKK
ncbi:MAG: GNAT family N-acetyltransferase [Candidatus Thiodiazotropha weberae]|nr:GNAT family N-acetyltransferase [Candidatus Thiodiazotropha lotti]MCG8011223.1 GNAT family N-acetyltransferase [Candidatus Thiodiazotropha lotti]MCW4210685.1 GNAT family N-acetyltransferase [Candidatus Thiodiazotropha lotti]MCW4216416.1 GNAT family N-acetyltransferase [Candidatus Thiodiazotropha lotti]